MNLTRIRNVGFLVILLIWGGTVTAQKSSLLWKISGNGLEKESYLFGTIHIICKEDFLMDERITAAFDQTEQLIMELDMSDPQLQAKMQQVSLNPGMKNLQSELDESTAKSLDEFLINSYGAGLAQLGILKPFVLSSMVMLKVLPCAEVESYEGFFNTRALAAGRPVAGLETVDFQVGIFDQIPQNIQLEELGKLVTDDSSKQDLEKLMTTYRSEDLDALYQVMNSSGMVADYRVLMLDDRNKTWVPKIEEAMQSKSVFVAVGAGHLSGEFGVLALLKKAGYTVDPIQ